MINNGDICSIDDALSSGLRVWSKCLTKAVSSVLLSEPDPMQPADFGHNPFQRECILSHIWISKSIWIFLCNLSSQILCHQNNNNVNISATKKNSLKLFQPFFDETSMIDTLSGIRCYSTTAGKKVVPVHVWYMLCEAGTGTTLAWDKVTVTCATPPPH